MDLSGPSIDVKLKERKKESHLGYTKKIQTFDRKCLPEETTFAPAPAHRLLHVEISQRRKSQIARKGFAILARLPREIVGTSERRRHRLLSPLI
jgi:hypothetical protein